jgi:hypothetical protein
MSFIYSRTNTPVEVVSITTIITDTALFIVFVTTIRWNANIPKHIVSCSTILAKNGIFSMTAFNAILRALNLYLACRTTI